MDLPQLKYFCDVAETQHMTLSSKRLNVVQPALSQSIHKLERELGVKLFYRKGRNIHLSNEGAAFYARVSKFLTELDVASKEIKEMAIDRKCRVKVGISSATNIVVDAIADFAAKNPEASFEITKNTDDSGEGIDVLVKTVTNPIDYQDNGATRVVRFNEPIGIAVPIESPYGADVDLDELTHERFIRLAGSKSFRGVCDRVCALYGFAPKTAFESDDPSVAKKIISLGLGVGFWPQISWGGLDSSGARWCSFKQEGFVRTLAVCDISYECDAPMSHAFFEFLVGYMENLWESKKSTFDSDA